LRKSVVGKPVHQENKTAGVAYFQKPLSQLKFELKHGAMKNMTTVLFLLLIFSCGHGK